MRTSRPVLRTALRGQHLLFVVLLVAAIAVNVAQFGAADRGAKTYWQAVHSYDTSGFAALSFAENDHLRFAFGLYWALAELAPGSTVTLAGDNPETVARLYGSGDAGSVRIDRDEVLDPMLAGFNPEPFIVASDEGGTSGKGRKGVPWAIALDAPDPRPADLRDAAGFLPEILAADRRGDARGDPREFLLFSWADPEVRPEFDRRLLLVETSLLPPEVREAAAP